MQLSPPTTSLETNRAVLLLPTAPKSAGLGDATGAFADIVTPAAGEGPVAFAELFPNLAGSRAEPREKISVPGDGSAAALFSLTPSSANFGATPPAVFVTSGTGEVPAVDTVVTDGMAENPSAPVFAPRAAIFGGGKCTAAVAGPSGEPQPGRAPAEPSAQKFSESATASAKPKPAAPALRRATSAASRIEEESLVSLPAMVPLAGPGTSGVSPEPAVASEVDSTPANTRAPRSESTCLAVAARPVVGEIFAGLTMPAEVARAMPPSASQNFALLAPTALREPSDDLATTPSVRSEISPPGASIENLDLAKRAPAPATPTANRTDVPVPPGATAAAIQADSAMTASASAEPEPRPRDEAHVELPMAEQSENFAEVPKLFAREKNFALSRAEKTFLSAAAKRVAPHAPELGTSVAETETAMPAATFSNRSAPAAVLERTSAAVTPTADAARETNFATPLAERPAAVATRAVDAVLNAVERFSAGDRHAVNLRFSVAGAELAVRVELRANEVRTTFHTDSPELRNALATEWSAATPALADRSVRLAPPVFTANENSAFNAFSGDTASRDRDARARRASEEFSVLGSARARGATAATTAPVEISPRLPDRSGTAQHLSTLA